MTRVRLLTLISGLSAALVPAAAFAQTTTTTSPDDQNVQNQNQTTTTTTTTTTGATGGDKYGGATVKEDMTPSATVRETPPPPPPVVEQPVVNVEQPEPARYGTPFGMSISAGGGVADFVDDDTRDMTGVAGAYDARLAIGTRTILGFEAAYVGSTQDISALGLDSDALLNGNGVEGVARLNIGTYMLQPYIFGGAGWTRYRVINDSFNTSDVNESDDVLTIPFGGGLDARLGDSGFMIDGRFTYRPTFNEDLVRTTVNGSDDLDSWAATAHLGYEF